MSSIDRFCKSKTVFKMDNSSEWTGFRLYDITGKSIQTSDIVPSVFINFIFANTHNYE